MTNIIIPGDGSPMANINFMRDNADEVVEDYSYQRVLTEDELIEERERFAEVSIELEMLEEQKKIILDEIMEKIKAKKKVASKHLMLIRVGRQEVTGEAFIFRDEDEKKIGTYDMNGVLLSDRNMKPTEIQRKLFNNNFNRLTGTNDF